MRTKTRGEAEAEISQAVVQFEKEFLGRGPLDAPTFFVSDSIVIRLRGILTPGDQKLGERILVLTVNDKPEKIF